MAGTCSANSVAKCFNSITVSTTTGCVLTVSPNDPGTSSAVLVPALFSDAATYKALVACPADGDASLSTTIANDAAALTGLKTVLGSAIWADALTTVGTLSAAGGVLTTTESSTGEDCDLEWQVISSTVSARLRRSGSGRAPPAARRPPCRAAPRRAVPPPRALLPRPAALLTPPRPTFSHRRRPSLPSPPRPPAPPAQPATPRPPAASPAATAWPSPAPPASPAPCAAPVSCAAARRALGLPARALPTRTCCSARSPRAPAARPAGSYSSSAATACIAVTAGKALPTLGAASDTSAACLAGSYAESAGTSDCAPCPVNTYQDAGSATTCKACPSKSYSHIPGAAACMKCINGRATSCTLSSCSGSAPSSGYAVAAVKSGGLSTLATCAAWDGAADTAFGTRPALFATCSMTEDTVLSFFVKATCEVVISPLADDTATASALACSAPGNADGSITGFYTAVDTILSKLSSE